MYKEDNNTLLVARYYDPDKLWEFYMEGFREEGYEEGIKLANIKVISNMMKYNYKLEDIVKATGLTKEEILKLKEENRVSNNSINKFSHNSTFFKEVKKTIYIIFGG